MRIIFLILILNYLNVTGQNICVVDSLTGFPVENAVFISDKGKNIVLTTNKKGIINLNQLTYKETVFIQHIAYKERRVKVNLINDSILLSPKINALPEVNLQGNPKRVYEFSKALVRKEMTLRDVSKKTTAEILLQEPGITIQENQAGGGSPNFRGLEANRLLLVVDGVSLNNTIFRSGHLQNASTINPFFIENISLITGPGSVNFGDGALGSAIVFNTLKPRLSKPAKHYLNQIFESSSQLVGLNYKGYYGGEKIAFASGFSVKSADNLKMGRKRNHNYTDWGNEAIICNGAEQLYTNYDQLDFIHKTLIKTGKLNSLLFNTQYSVSSKVNRFDKLNDIVNNSQKYSDWYYGPQKRLLQSIKLYSKKTTILYDELEAVISFQQAHESRHHKKEGDSLMSNRLEKVTIYDAIINVNKSLSKNKLSYGAGARQQFVNSNANRSSDLGEVFYNTTRYPDGGSSVINLFLYSQISCPINERLIFYLGGRGNYNKLTSLFIDTLTYVFPFSEIKNKNSSIVGSSLINYKLTNNITLFASGHTGFRNPNLDDIGKVFSKNDVYVIVPNENLKPEKSKNIELGFTTSLFKKLYLKAVYFNTYITNAIVRESASLNGQDSIIYDGEMMMVQMNKNIESANIYGLNFNYKYQLANPFTISGSINYLKGVDLNNLPLSHIPPINGKFNIEYLIKKSSFNFNLLYNGWKKAEDYDDAGVDNLEEATIDGNPSWYILSLNYTSSLENIKYTIGVENILDFHYKTFSSGLSASGRNFTLSLHFDF